MTLHVDSLERHSLTDLNTMVDNYERAIRVERSNENAARSRRRGYEADLEQIHLAIGRKRIDPNAPMTDDQRRALFAAFTEVFGHSDRPNRLAFTGMVLGKAPTQVSWSAHKHGALTYGEASKVLDALDVLNV